MNWQDIQAAAVIGTGMMGPGIALTLAIGGLRATIVSRSSDSAEAGLVKARKQAQSLREYELLAADETDRVLARLSASANLEEAAAPADIVIESAPENMEFKKDLFARLDAMTRADAVLASNTSGLSITEIASRCRFPERVLTTHFWNPPYIMPLVEIVLGQRTDRAIAEAVRALLAHCGKTPVIVKKDTPGQLGNRLQMALVREAIHIVEEGIADPEDVDLATMTGFGLRLPVYGIFEHQDIVGLDLGMGVLDYVSQDLCNHRGTPRITREMMERGEFGVKSGKGFYDWSKKDADTVKARRDRFVLGFLRSQRLPPST